jgi:hypothetical protein
VELKLQFLRFILKKIIYSIILLTRELEARRYLVVCKAKFANNAFSLPDRRRYFLCLKQAITRVTTLHIIMIKLNKVSYVTIETNPFHIYIPAVSISPLWLSVSVII